MTKARFTAVVSEEANTQLRRYADAHGLKKGALVEQAVLHHLLALRELPAGITFRPVEAAAFDRELKPKARRR